MAILVSLETSTGACSVAVHKRGKLIGSTELHRTHAASSELAVMLNDLLKSCGVSPAELEGVAISAGPGSYTGLRIGVATAKGICFALNIPLISVNTLELLAYQFVSSQFPPSQPDLTARVGIEANVVLCPMLDARRMEVYYLLCDWQLNVLEETAAKIIDEHSFGDWLVDRRVVFLGDGSEKCQDTIRHPNAMFIQGITPAAAKLGELAFRKFESGSFELLASFEPFYLKDFVIKKPKIQI